MPPPSLPYQFNRFSPSYRQTLEYAALIRIAARENGQQTMNNSLYESRLSELTRISQGKVRDIYAVDDDHLLIVTTDRMSAFDVVLPDRWYENQAKGTRWVMHGRR